jgi:hypothetical protein
MPAAPAAAGIADAGPVPPALAGALLTALFALHPAAAARATAHAAPRARHRLRPAVMSRL